MTVARELAEFLTGIAASDLPPAAIDAYPHGEMAERPRCAESGRSPKWGAAERFDNSGPSSRRAHRRRCATAWRWLLK